MGRSKGSLAGVTKLGSPVTVYESEYNPQLLECFENNFPNRNFWARFTCPEFHSINPATGEPFGATVLIQYIPAKTLVESKSLKLYLYGFRHATLRRPIAEVVCDDLTRLLSPKYLEVEVRCAPREGIEARGYSNHTSKDGQYAKLALARKQAFKASLETVPVLEELPEEIISL